MKLLLPTRAKVSLDAEIVILLPAVKNPSLLAPKTMFETVKSDALEVSSDNKVWLLAAETVNDPWSAVTVTLLFA